MSASPIRVFIRARPTNNFASNNIKIDEIKSEITINIPKDASRGIINHQHENWQFNFDKILLNTSQEVVFNLTAKDIIQGALEGYSGTVIAYGQTGAGKTTTITGSSSDFKYRGIIPRTISELYSQIKSKYDQEIVVRVSYVEIYNEQIFDLLSTVSQD